MSDFFKSMTVENEPLKGEELFGSQIVCKKCKAPTRTMINGLYFKVPCKCYKRNKQLLKTEQKSLFDNYNILSKPQYKNCSFASTDIVTAEYGKVLEKAKDHCKNKKGLYIYGDTGVGKTHLMVCMAKELKRSLVIKLEDLLDSVKRSYNDKNIQEYKLMDEIYKVPYLFLDDLGIEEYHKNGGDNFNQKIIYKVVENRCLNNRPTFYSSNYKLSQLRNERGIEKRTIDRIAGSCDFIKLNGESYRLRDK